MANLTAIKPSIDCCPGFVCKATQHSCCDKGQVTSTGVFPSLLRDVVSARQDSRRRMVSR